MKIHVNTPGFIGLTILGWFVGLDNENNENS